MSRRDERRRGRRVPLSAGWSDEDGSVAVSDLSETGVCVHTSERPPIDALIELRFSVFTDPSLVFEGRGRVARHGLDEDILGVEFVELDEAARDIIRKILLRHEAQRTRDPLNQTATVLRTHRFVLRLMAS